MTQKHQYCVVASRYDYTWQTPADWEDDAPEHLRLTARTFEAFIYRFWIENEIWFKTSRFFPDTLSSAQESYLEHYIDLET
ncbi:hypothetical protein [Rubripirellula tenax]|uniref:hypothetical protein n=1 Tax=Rubripirellula tenax TaxID=2528015 RepID=UPI0011B55B92|nr:hypothetical protein [Rubripirellula tenax]